jgi:16S rRNA (cytosine1407-C5)-methyltransferase
MATLQANMRRMGLLNVVCSAYPGEGLPLPDHKWPYILCDVPCSGWGTEERHPGIRELWTKDKALRLVDLQWKILSRAAGLLAPGGKLVYSTCTTNPMENRMQVERAVRELGLGLEGIPPLEGIIPHADSEHGCLVVDGEASGSQGFFVALLRKPGELEFFAENDPAEIGDPTARLPSILQEFAHCLPRGGTEIQKGRVFFRPARALDVLPSMYHWKGPFLGRIGKNRLVPAPHQRTLLPCGPEKGLDLEDLGQIRGLISGASMPAPEHASDCPGLYRLGLPLAWLRRKGARIFWGS